MKCPLISKNLIYADDAYLAAQISCVLGQPNFYLPIVDGPRLLRPDADNELIRRNNIAARLEVDRVILAGLSQSSCKRVVEYFGTLSKTQVLIVNSQEDIQKLEKKTGAPLICHPDSLAIGTLQALRQDRPIEFSPEGIIFDNEIKPKSDHFVVCEAGDVLVQVIAANYAHSLRAGLKIIPKIPDDEAKNILEQLYLSQGQNLDAVRKNLRG